MRIRVHAIGVNPFDWKRREGQYRASQDVHFRAGFGVEGAGVMDEIGPGVTGVA